MSFGATREIFLMRHGETVWNVQKRFQGRLDSPLTDKGRHQAEDLGRILQNRFSTACPLTLYQSPLTRVRVTSSLLQKHVRFASVKIVGSLREISMGDWEGRRITDLIAADPTLEAVFKRHEAYRQAPRGEGFLALVNRVESFLNQIEDQACVILSHAMITRAIRGLYLNMPLEEMALLPCEQGIVWHLHDGRVDCLGTAPHKNKGNKG